MNVDWIGVYPAVTTKFHEDESIDFDGFEKGIDAQINAGVHGIVICGSLGEASTLSSNEKIALLESAMNVCAGRCPLLLNIAEKRTHTAVEMVREAEAAGADGFMLLPPLNYKAQEEEVVAYFTEIARSTSLPIMIYNNPVDYGIRVSEDMFARLVNSPNIQAVKESTRDVTNVLRMQASFGQRIKILCGVDTLALECLVLGADGWVAGLVNAFPEETVYIYEKVKSGHIQDALEVYRWFMPLLELDIHPKLVQYIKLAEVYTGLGTEWTRAPRLGLTGAERKLVSQTIEDALANRPVLTQ